MKLRTKKKRKELRMKRIFILVVITLLAVGSSFAQDRTVQNQKTLIDFTKLTADSQDDQGNPQNEYTLMDFSNEATGNFSARQKRSMTSSLAIANWDIVFAASSRNVTTRDLSYTREAKSNISDNNVMGVRIHFPTGPVNSWARVQPPFSIPAFEPGASGTGTGTEPSKFEGPDGEGGYGIIKNVGTIKSIAVEVFGLNFPHTLGVILIDDKGEERIYNMGSLNFEGWGQLRWDNPAYVDNVRNRDLRLTPIYPDMMPYVKFGGFIIQKQANMQGGDFITYFSKVDVLYDAAVLPVDSADENFIDHEGTWNIIQDRDVQRRVTDMQRLGQLEVQRQMDLERQVPMGEGETVRGQNFGRYQQDNE